MGVKGNDVFKKILVSNRGEIACRIFRTAKEMGIKTVAIYSEADERSLHVGMADEAYCVGPAPAQLSYLNIDSIIEVCRQAKIDAVHPGYGFLAENSKFIDALSRHGIAFIGPSSESVRAMGDKVASKKIAQAAHVNVIPGFIGEVRGIDHAIEIANDIGFPVMIKASAGGGGKGMRIARTVTELEEGIFLARREAGASFGDNRIFLERFIERPRHIEIQILADRFGNCVHLGERECSIQRRNQKIIEECPSLALTEELRQEMGAQACRLAVSVGYESAGTVEFVLDARGSFYFLEMNTRIQVEHPVTELVTGIDIVRSMIKIASGLPLDIIQENVSLEGWAIESRIYSEDPDHGFVPSIGRIRRFGFAGSSESDVPGLRHDSGVGEGSEISLYYDPMISKLCSYGDSRAEAISNMRGALSRLSIEGVVTNINFLYSILLTHEFQNGDLTTAFVDEYLSGKYSSTMSRTDLVFYAEVIAAVVRFVEIERSYSVSQDDSDGFRLDSRMALYVINREVETLIYVQRDKDGFLVSGPDRAAVEVSGSPLPGQTFFEGSLDGLDIFAHLKISRNDVDITVCGERFTFKVLSEAAGRLNRFMKSFDSQDIDTFVHSPMPGMITSIHVSVGDTVAPGQPLCNIEAMKMESIIRAEGGGVISVVGCSIGEQVATGATLFSYEDQ